MKNDWKKSWYIVIIFTRICDNSIWLQSANTVDRVHKALMQAFLILCEVW